MPTAAKLFAALGLAFVGFFAAELAKPAFPESTQFGRFSLIVAGIGLLIGWRVLGPRAHRAGGVGDGVGSGVLAAVVLVFWTFTLFALREMILRAMDMRFDGVVAALTGVFGIVLEYAAILAAAPMAIGWLAVGGVATGLLAVWGARTFR